jgi:hypothetical protein
MIGLRRYLVSDIKNEIIWLDSLKMPDSQIGDAWLILHPKFRRESLKLQLCSCSIHTKLILQLTSTVHFMHTVIYHLMRPIEFYPSFYFS